MSPLCIDHQSIGVTALSLLVAPGAGFEATCCATSGCWVITVTMLMFFSEYNSSMSSRQRHRQFGGVFITDSTGGFLLLKSPVRPTGRVCIKMTAALSR